MDFVLTIGGLIIGISAFLYLLHFIDKSSRAITKKSQVQNTIKTNPQIHAAQNTETPQDSLIKNLSDDLKDRLPQRACPLCTRTLTRDEPLYATNIEIGGERKILIYGCPYCYKGEKKQ